MSEIVYIATNATNELVTATQNGANHVVSLGKIRQGTITAGTLTIAAKVPNAEFFETPTPLSTIDLSAPVSITIESPLSHFQFTVTGFAGTSPEVPIALNSYG